MGAILSHEIEYSLQARRAAESNRAMVYQLTDAIMAEVFKRGTPEFNQHELDQLMLGLAYATGAECYIQRVGVSAV